MHPVGAHPADAKDAIVARARVADQPKMLEDELVGLLAVVEARFRSEHEREFAHEPPRVRVGSTAPQSTNSRGRATDWQSPFPRLAVKPKASRERRRLEGAKGEP